MAIYRQVQTLFWQDGFIMELTPEDKYFFLYLMTSPRTTQCGIYELPKRMAEAELGYSRETIDRLIKRFEDYGKILYCAETREIMILNWIKYNFINSRNTITCINKELKEVKNRSFISILYKICSKKGYAVEEIFQGVPLNPKDIVKDKKEGTGITGEELEDSERRSGAIEYGIENLKGRDAVIEEIEDIKEAAGVVNERIETIENNKIYINDFYKESMDENDMAENIGSDLTINDMENGKMQINLEENKKKVFFNSDMKNQLLYRGLAGACKPLGEKEEETYNKKESSYKQKVIDNNSKNELQHKSSEDNGSKVLLEFNKNIRQATIRDIEKIIVWLKEFEEEVIIEAISQAVKYNAAHTGYLESVLKNWRTLGLFTMEKLKAYRSKGIKEKQEHICNADAYRYLD